MDRELRETLVDLNNDVITEALNKGWEPDLETITQLWKRHLHRWTKVALVEFIVEEALDIRDAMPTKVSVLRVEFDAQANVFLSQKA